MEIVAIIKQFENGKYRDITIPLWNVGDTIVTQEGKQFKVTKVNGCKITLESEEGI